MSEDKADTSGSGNKRKTTILCGWRSACACFVICCFGFICVCFVWWIIKETIVEGFFCKRGICPVREHCEAEEVGFWAEEMCGCYKDTWAKPDKCDPHTYPWHDVNKEGQWAECGEYEDRRHEWTMINLEDLPACYHELMPEFQQTAYHRKMDKLKGGAGSFKGIESIPP